MELVLEKTVYTTEEVSQLLGLSVQQVYRLTRENSIPHKRVGRRRILFPKEMIHDWLKSED